MKKTLLLAALAVAAPSVMALTPEVLPSKQIVAFSPDGKWALSSLYGEMELISLDGGTNVVLSPIPDTDQGIAEGQGNCMSALGMVLAGAEYDLTATYWKAGEWVTLPTPSPELFNMLNGVTPDEMRICGSVGLQKMSIEEVSTPMLAPAVWDRQPDGSYTYTILPYPALDFSGRVPNYVTAICISDDGRTIAGQLQDYSGAISEPIVYRLDDDGNWNYTLIASDMINPDHLVFPEWPGESPTQPMMEDYLTPEEMAEYEEALENWDGDFSNYPDLENFLSDEGRAAYNAALAAWEVEYDAWMVKFQAFYEVFDAVIATSPTFEFNNILLSSNGSQLVTTAGKDVEDPNSWSGYTTYNYPILFNLANGTRKEYPYEDNVIVTAIARDATIFGSTANEYGVRSAMVCPAGADAFQPLVGWMTAKNAEIGQWISDNCTHDIQGLDPETWEVIEIQDVDCTGVPRCTSDLSIIGLTAENYWDYDVDDTCFAYLFPTGFTVSSVGRVSAAETMVSVRKGGFVKVSADVKEIRIMDLSGRTVFKSEVTSDVISTGLPSGVYIVNAVTQSGKTKAGKASF